MGCELLEGRKETWHRAICATFRFHVGWLSANAVYVDSRVRYDVQGSIAEDSQEWAVIYDSNECKAAKDKDPAPVECAGFSQCFTFYGDVTRLRWSDEACTREYQLPSFSLSRRDGGQGTGAVLLH